MRLATGSCYIAVLCMFATYHMTITGAAAACVLDTATNTTNCAAQALTDVPLDNISVSTVSLDLSNNPLGTLKNESFVTLSNLRELMMPGASVHTIEPDAFLGLTQLTSLNVASNGLTQWPDFTSSCGSLVVFNAIENSLGQASNQITCLLAVEELYLSMNGFSHFPNMSAIGHTVVILELKANSISVITENDLNPLTAVEYLDLSNNPLTTLKNESFVTLSNLRELMMPGASVHTIEPDAFLGLTQLTTWNVVSNGLSQWPDFTSSCGSLVFINADANRLGEASNQITCLLAVETLLLAYNNFYHFPNMSAIGHTLLFLGLDANFISVITESDLAPLTAIKGIRIAANRLTNCDAFWVLPAGAGVAVFQNILIDPTGCLPFLYYQAYLRYNDITHVPVFSYCPFVVIDLADNSARTIAPQAFANCTDLNELWLNKNQLTEFPDCTGIGDTLFKLSLGMNSIATISPAALDELTELQYLTMASNHLTSFPNVAGPSRTLQTLNLRDNAFTTMPKLDVIGASLKSVTFEGCAGLVALHDEDIAGLPSLQWLNLKETSIAAIHALPSAPPGLVINLEGSPVAEVAVELMMAMGRSEGLTLLLAGTPIEKLPSACGNVNGGLDLTSTPIALCSCDMLWLKMVWEASGTVTLDLPVTCSGLDWQQASPQQIYDVCETGQETSIKVTRTRRVAAGGGGVGGGCALPLMDSAAHDSPSRLHCLATCAATPGCLGFNFRSGTGSGGQAAAGQCSVVAPGPLPDATHELPPEDPALGPWSFYAIET